ncbi:MAG: SDR family oxidoreductase [Candidatus Sumerlaeia bacterium]|nr:SDR family oxidoreductase [Candidatus Sumerlaeia bacterium]
MNEQTSSVAAVSAAAAPKNRLAGKVVLVTGSTRGIGRAVAHACALEGAKIAICGRDKNDLYAVSEEIKTLKADCCAIKVDLSDYNSAVKLVDAVCRAYGRIDVLINNHSMLGPREPIMEYSAENWDKVIATNLSSVFWLTKEALGKMAPQRSGSIINVVSGAGNKGRAKWGAYGISKAGVENMTQIIADEMREQKVRANSVNPGPVHTDMRSAAFPGEDISKINNPQDITNIFVYLASDASAGVSGEQFDARDWMGREDF